MKITVVIPNFNDIRIDRALFSVFSQQDSEFEVIVVHGGNLSFELKEVYSKYKIEKFILESDNGIFDALNKGISQASGDIIYLMGADDCLSSKSVFKDVALHFDNGPQIDGVCIGCVFVNSNQKVIRKWFPARVSSQRIRRGFFPPHFSLFLSRSLYVSVGPFKYRQTNNIATDIIWLMDLSILKPSARIIPLNTHYLIMEYGGASTGTWSAILKQFKVVHKYVYLRRKYFPNWFIFSLIRTSSKIFQFRFFSKL